MKEIDHKDRKILYELDLNSRQPISKISNKLNIHGNSIKYRIKKLEKNGIITNYYTVIDSFKLGYLPVKFYLKFKFTTLKIEEEIIEFFKQNKYTWWVASLEGRLDLAVHMLVDNFKLFSDFWDLTLEKYNNYIEEALFAQYFNLISFEYSYLSDKNVLKRKKFVSINDGKNIKIDEVSFNILKLIAPNARKSLSDISEALNLTPEAVMYRIKKLEKLNIIQGYRVNLNLQKIGYKNFKVDIFLGDYQQRKKIIEYIKNNNNLVFICKSAGISHLELGFHLININNLFEIINDLKIKFPNAIKNYYYLFVSKQHKWEFLPKKKDSYNY
jgi:DNA-binding Lrp family transcriptional regulator